MIVRLCVHAGSEHECLGLILNNLGFLYKETKAFDQAERCYQEALRVYMRLVFPRSLYRRGYVPSVRCPR